MSTHSAHETNLTPENGGRRMSSDKLLDAAAQAVRMERLEGQQNLLAQQVRASLDALTSTLSTLQIETRAVTNKIHDFASLQHSQDSNKTTIDEVKKSIVDLNGRLEEWFADLDNRNDKRWEQYERNRDDWRLRHEAEQENDKKELEREIRGVRETVIRSMGWGTAAGTLVVVVVSGFLWSLNERFDNVTTRFASTEKAIEAQVKASQYNRELIDAGKERLHAVELYLVGGGANRDAPYTPQQRKTDGQR